MRIRLFHRVKLNTGCAAQADAKSIRNIPVQGLTGASENRKRDFGLCAWPRQLLARSEFWSVAVGSRLNGVETEGVKSQFAGRSADFGVGLLAKRKSSPSSAVRASKK